MRTVITSLAALAAVTALAACSTTTGGSGPEHVRTHSAAPATSTAPTVTPVEPTNRPTSFPSSTPPATQQPTEPATTQPATPVVHNELDSALLDAAQIGASYTKVSSATDTAPLPCTPNDPPVATQIRNVATGRATFVGEAGDVQVSEQIFVYGSVTEAVRHQQIAELGLACSKGTSAGQPIDIRGPVAVGDELSSSRIDKAEAWSVANNKIGGSLVLVRIHAVVVQFAFVATAGTSPDVSAQRVVNTAVSKLLQAA